LDRVIDATFYHVDDKSPYPIVGCRNMVGYLNGAHAVGPADKFAHLTGNGHTPLPMPATVFLDQ
jgi:hypothetical protein